jgi:hypothetical protein
MLGWGGRARVSRSSRDRKAIQDGAKRVLVSDIVESGLGTRAYLTHGIHRTGASGACNLRLDNGLCQIALGHVYGRSLVSHTIGPED